MHFFFTIATKCVSFYKLSNFVNIIAPLFCRF